MNDISVNEASHSRVPHPTTVPGTRHPVPATRLSVSLWRILSTLAGLALLTAGAMWSGLGGLLLIMAALVPLGAAAADVSLIAGVRDLLHHAGKISS